MRRACAVALTTAAALGCGAGEDPQLQPIPQSIQQGLGLVPDLCTDPWCGRNTKDIGNGFVDQVFFDGSANPGGQTFEGWHTSGGDPIAPRLTARTLYGVVGGQSRIGNQLEGSVLTLKERDGRQLQIRFDDARYISLPNGLATWVYRLSRRRGFTAWWPLCSLFDHTPAEEARYAFLGTRELVLAAGNRVQPVDPSDGKLTIACPNSATGKMVGLGAVRTTAVAEQMPTVPEMTAMLRALTLSPTGGESYTHSGVGILISVVRTGVDNNSEALAGGFEGHWTADGALCFEKLRIADPGVQWQLYNETHVPACDEVEVDPSQILVNTHLFFGVYPNYPPPRPTLPVASSLAAGP